MVKYKLAVFHLHETLRSDPFSVDSTAGESVMVIYFFSFLLVFFF